MRITAANRAARARGVHVGMAAADAFAVLPSLQTHPAQPEKDRRALLKLADWCTRYTPWTNIDGADGLWLDVTGATHLFGGEEKLLRDLSLGLKSIGFRNRPALAATPGAAWALARHAPAQSFSDLIVPLDSPLDDSLKPLPVEALRLENADTIRLRQLGLKTIGQLIELPRSSLARRFRDKQGTENVLARLDQALSLRGEPISPIRPPCVYRVKKNFAEPCLAREGFPHVVRELLEELCRLLERQGQGARRLNLVAYHADGRVTWRQIATARPSRNVRHLQNLFREQVETIDPDFGIDMFILSAERVEPLSARQVELAQADTGEDHASSESVARLVDRLSNRLGAHNVRQLIHHQSHIPERAEQSLFAGMKAKPWPMTLNTSTRPLRLLQRPEPIEVIAEIPDGPPRMFRWRRVPRRIARAAGPERISPEWWHDLQGQEDTVPGPAQTRDYYDIEDNEGRRYWVFREGLYEDAAGGQTGCLPRWYIHGLFS